MLTHRNKKPYECKAEGCGKSYCDARSLRRHTENHHTNNSAQAAVTASTSTSGSGSTGSSDDASPLGSSCIHYAPPPQPQQQTPTAPPPPYPATSSPSTTTTAAATATSSSSGSGGSGTKQAPSQLQQLLASEPASATSVNTATSSKVSPSLAFMVRVMFRADAFQSFMFRISFTTSSYCIMDRLDLYMTHRHGERNCIHFITVSIAIMVEETSL